MDRSLENSQFHQQAFGKLPSSCSRKVVRKKSVLTCSRQKRPLLSGSGVTVLLGRSPSPYSSRALVEVYVSTIRNKRIKKTSWKSSLVVQWYRVLVPVHGIEVDSWSRKIPHVMGQLGLSTTMTEARTPRACVPQQVKPPQWEACPPQWKVAPVCSN